MLSNYCTMFTIIFTLCIFAAVNSQPPPSSFNFPHYSSSQSVSYSGTGSSSVASSGTAASYSEAGTSYVSNSGLAVSSSGSQPSFSTDGNVQLYPPPALDPNVEIFAHSLTQLLLSSTVLNTINFVIIDSYTLLKKVASIILERENVLDPILDEISGKAGSEVGVITKDLYYNTMTHMFALVLSINSRLTQETALTYPTAILSFVEGYGIKNGIFDTESVLEAVANGVLDFAKSIGIDKIPNLKLAFLMFVNKLKALARAVEI